MKMKNRPRAFAHLAGGPYISSVHLVGIAPLNLTSGDDLAHAAIKRKNGELWDVAHRISHQLHVCDWRLRQVSDGYASALSVIVKTNRHNLSHGLYDQFVWLAYMALHSFLIDACILRDSLAEFRALTLQQSGVASWSGRISSLASLIKHYSRTAVTTSPIDAAISAAAKEEGWLRELGAYRDLVVHYAPIAHAANDMYAICTAVPIDGEFYLPSLKLPIPSNPAEIAKRRHTGEHVADPEQTYARFANALRDHSAAKDGLLYAHGALGLLAVLARDLLATAPFSPEIPVLTDKDVIGVEVVRRGTHDDQINKDGGLANG